MLNMAVPMRRKSPRKSVVWPAVAHFGFMRMPCKIINLSRLGAKLEFASPPTLIDKGLVITEKVGALSAQLIWQKGNFAGVAFTDADAVSTIEPALKPTLHEPQPTRFGRRTRVTSAGGEEKDEA